MGTADMPPDFFAASLMARQLQEKDRELATLRARVEELEHECQQSMKTIAEERARAEAAEAEASRLRERVATLEELIRWAHDTLYEINLSNYDHDEVCRLNYASVEVILGLAPALEAHDEARRALAAQEQARVAGEPQSDKDGWVEWGGGECPIPNYVKFEMKWRTGEVVGNRGIPARAWRWKHNNSASDIIAYRILPEETK